MLRPTVADLPPELARATKKVAGVLRDAGWRSWIVGGAVRDLALGIAPKDVDLATPAVPEEIERLFDSTHAVGRAFGTIVVHQRGCDIQVTTFRAEGAYEDARRPSHVRFGTNLEEDAARRDFTCNALYLDPLDDELVDPTGGLADLEARRLRCVGDAAVRFAEDGLRLLRLARLSASYGLEIDAATRAGAARSLAALRGISAERVLAELLRLADGPDPGLGLWTLLTLGILPLLPGLTPWSTASGATLEQRCAAVARLGPSCGGRRFLGTLLSPAETGQTPLARESLVELRTTRAYQEGIARAWSLEPEIAACVEAESGGLRRSRWIRLVRSEEFEDALAVFGAWHPDLAARVGELAARARAVEKGERFPTPLVGSQDLARLGVPRGPRWSELLREAEDLQLDGELSTPEEARAWLARRSSDQGSSRREDPAQGMAPGIAREDRDGDEERLGRTDLGGQRGRGDQ